MNSYWGGAVTAIGGALVTGAWIRITRAKRSRYAWFLESERSSSSFHGHSKGCCLLSRINCSGSGKPQCARMVTDLLTGVVGASWFAYDNYRVTGHPLRLPYRQYYEQYEVVPPFSFMPISTTPSRTFRHFDLESRVQETYDRARSWRLLVDRPLDWLTLLRYYYGNLIWLLPLVAFTPFLWRSRRTRFAGILAAVIAAVSVTEVWWYPHYGAPFMAALLILAAQSMRYLRQWKQDGREVGRFLVSAMPVAVLLVMVASETEAIVTHRTADQIQARSLQKESAEQELLGKYSWTTCNLCSLRRDARSTPRMDL